MFQLDPVLAADTLYIGDFPLCALLLSRDANYPWCILVPRVEGINEIYQLDPQQQQQLLQESCLLAETLQQQFKGDKMNVAALGNMVPQLHLHHVVRYRDDPAWPAPIWGTVPARAYDENTLQDRLNRILSALAGQAFSAAGSPDR